MIGNRDRKYWDLRAPIIWDNCAVFRTSCAILTTYIYARIHAHVVGSCVDVFTVLDQMVKVSRFSYGFFTAMALNKVGIKNQRLDVILCSGLMEKVSFLGSKTRLQFRAVDE